jgi:hypothetical protein
MAKSYVVLSLNEKVKVIEAKETDKLSVREIMMRFKCGKTQVYNTLKQKDNIMNDWLQGNGRIKRKAKITSNEEITRSKGRKVYWGQNVQRKTYSVIVWEYGGRNGNASCNWKISKTKVFQEPEN